MQIRKLLIVLSGVAGLLAVYGCGSGSTDGGDANNNPPGSPFVSDGSSSGRIQVSVESTDLAVADTSGFGVSVKNASGVPQAGVAVTCDSEAGVGILEPTTGTEITDSSGNISGRLGCDRPGSYQFGCRMPIGGGFRNFVRIKCTGSRPAGFNGFTGAAGGNLGTGGSAVDPEGAVRVTKIEFVEGTNSGSSIDTTQGTCGTGTPTAEPFFDTYVDVSIVNDLSVAVVVTGMTFTLNNADGAGSPFTSTRQAPTTSTFEIPANTTEAVVVRFPFAKAVGGSKVFAGSSSTIPADLGFRNISFKIFGERTDGVSLDAFSDSGSASIGNFNNCAS